MPRAIRPQVRRGAPRGDPRRSRCGTSPRAATTAPRPRRSRARPASPSPTCSGSSAPSGAVPRLHGPLLRAASSTSFREAAAAAARGRAAERDGRGVRGASCCPTATRCCSRCRATRPCRARDPRPRARGYSELVRDGRRRWPASTPRRPGTSSPTGCCSTSSPRSTSRDRGGCRAGRSVIFRAIGGAIAAGGALRRSCCVAAACLRAAGVRRARLRATTSTTRRPRRRWPATPSTARPARSRRRASSRWCGSARRPTRAQAQRRSRASRARCGTPAWRRVVALRAAAATARLVSRDGRSTYLLATFREDADAGALDAHRGRGSSAMPGVTLGGGAIAAPQVGDQVSEDIARAELLAFPILFLLSLLVFRSASRRCCRWPSAATTILLTFLAMRVVNARSSRCRSSR